MFLHPVAFVAIGGLGLSFVGQKCSGLITATSDMLTTPIWRWTIWKICSSTVSAMAASVMQMMATIPEARPICPSDDQDPDKPLPPDKEEAAAVSLPTEA